MSGVRNDLAGILRERHGHFELESGHHSDLWLDLESLFVRPSAVRPLAAELARRLRPYDIDVVCGPLVEGAFMGLLVAEELGADFVYAERRPRREGAELFPFAYRIPDALRNLQNRRAAIANDVINAGSAVRGALQDLEACGARVVVIGTLLALGSRGVQLAQEAAVPLESLETEDVSVWAPAECPLCSSATPLTPFYGG